MSRPRGVTLVELLVALLLAGIVGTSVIGVTVAAGRLYRRQAAAGSVSRTLRGLSAMLPIDLAGVDPGDSAGGDLVDTEPTGLAFKAVRSLSFLCAPPQLTDPRRGRLLVAPTPRYGLRALDPRRDSLFVYAEADPADPDDDYWLRADLRGTRQAGPCRDGRTGELLDIAAVTPAGGLGDVRAGAPVLGYEVVRLAAYGDRDGVWWLGVRLHGKARGWSSIQPVLGPLSPGGLRVSYLGASGLPTPEPGGVRRIVIVGVARPAGDAASLLPHLEDSVRIEIGLPHGRRP